MYKIAFIYGNTLVYWNSVVVALGAFTGILFFWAAYLRKSDNIVGAALTCPLSIVLSLILARLIYWYFRADSYESMLAAMTDFSHTGFALAGVFAGCLVAVGILRLVKAVKNLPFLLDCMSIGGCAAISIGRLGCFFAPDDRGAILSGVTELPWVFPVVNSTSGLLEYRFATFLFQAIAAGCIFIVLLFIFRTDRHRDGDIALLFLLFYCASQIVLESTRYDSLRLRVNGFISIVQVLCALALVFVISVFLVRYQKQTGWRFWHIALWLLLASGLGGAGYMEYHVQRHGNQAFFSYLVMSGCLALIVTLGVVLWCLSKPGKSQAHSTGEIARESRMRTCQEEDE